LICELRFQSTTLLKKLNETEFENLYVALNNIQSNIDNNICNLKISDINRLECNLDILVETLKKTRSDMKSAAFSKFGESVEKLKIIQNSIALFEKEAYTLHGEIKKYREVDNGKHERQKKDFDDFMEYSKNHFSYVKESLDYYLYELKNIDFSALKKDINEELKNTFKKSIIEISKNNQLAKKLSEKNLLAIENHNKSIKSINIKVIFATFCIAFVAGVLTITTFQVEALNKIILSDKIENLAKIKNKIEELEEEKESIGDKYNISKNVQKILDENVVFFADKNQKYIVVKKKNAKSAYISDFGHGVIELR